MRQIIVSCKYHVLNKQALFLLHGVPSIVRCIMVFLFDMSLFSSVNAFDDAIGLDDELSFMRLQ